MLSSSGTSSPIGHLVLCSHWTDPWLTVASLPSWHSLPCCHHQVRALLLATFCSSLFSLDRSMTDCRKSSLLTLASMLSSSGTSYPIGHLVLITHWIYPLLTVASFPSWHSLRMLSSTGTIYPIAWPLSSRFSLDRMWERSLRILGYSILLSYWQLSAFSSVIGQKLRWVARLHNVHEIQGLFLGTSSFFGHSYSRSQVMITRPQFSNWPPPLFLILWYFS